MNGSGQGDYEQDAEEIICDPRRVEYEGQTLNVFYQYRASEPGKPRLWKILTKGESWEYIKTAIRYIEVEHGLCQSLAHELVYGWVKKEATPEP